MKGFIDGEYPYFDNCDAINVNRTQNIPMDYEGLMGVPITFLHRFNPKQFQIVRFRKGDDNKDLSVGGKSTYFRILIKRRYRRGIASGERGQAPSDSTHQEVVLKTGFTGLTGL